MYTYAHVCVCVDVVCALYTCRNSCYMYITYICIYHFMNFFHRHVKSVVMGGRMEEILISRVILTKTYCEGVIV